jgi:8-oxo-dGTP pyrophosphatase MutT (NUDIX family)
VGSERSRSQLRHAPDLRRGAICQRRPRAPGPQDLRQRLGHPGAYVDAGESPAAACRRELKEELGIEREPRRLLIVDWAPSAREGDKILYIFDCCPLGADEQRIHLGADELDRWEWVPVGQVPEYVIPRLARRLISAYRARAAGMQLYLEHGQPVMTPADSQLVPPSP